MGTDKFNGHLLIVQKIGSLKNHTERTFSNLLSDTVMNTHDIRG